MSLFGYPRGLRHVDAGGKDKFLAVATRPDVVAYPNFVDAVVRIPTNGVVRTFDIIGCADKIKVDEWLARMADHQPYFDYWAAQGYSAGQLVRHKAAITDAARLHVDVLGNELRLSRSLSESLDAHTPTPFAWDGGSPSKSVGRMWDAIFDAVSAVYVDMKIVNGVEHVVLGNRHTMTLWCPWTDVFTGDTAQWANIMTVEETIELRQKIDAAVLSVLTLRGKFRYFKILDGEFVRPGAGIMVYDGVAGSYAVGTTDPYLLNVSFNYSMSGQTQVTAELRRGIDSLITGLAKTATWTAALRAPVRQLHMKFAWDSRPHFPALAADAMCLPSGELPSRDTGTGAAYGTSTMGGNPGTTPKGRTFTLAWNTIGTGVASPVTSGGFASGGRTREKPIAESFPILAMMSALKTSDAPSKSGEVYNVSNLALPGVAGTTRCLFQFSDWNYRIVLPYYLNELVVREPAITVAKDAVDAKHSAIAMASTDVHVEILGTAVRAYLVEMKAAFPANAAEIDAALKKGEAYGDAVFRSTLLDVPAIRVLDAVKSTELYRKVDKADEDLYAQFLSKDPVVTFKQAQNRINSLVPQDVWLAVVDDAINPIEELPETLRVYATTPLAYRVTVGVDGVWSVCTPEGAPILQVPIEDAAVLRMAGVAFQATVAGANEAALESLKTIVGTDMTFEQLGFASTTLGGTWQDLEPIKFLDRGYPSPARLNSADATARCWIAYKGINASSSEMMIKAMMDVTPLNAGLN